MEEASTQAKEYSKQRIRLAVYQLLLTLAFLIIMHICGASVFLRDMVARWSQNFYMQVGLYLVIFSVVYYLLFVGLDFYGRFQWNCTKRLLPQTKPKPAQKLAQIRNLSDVLKSEAPSTSVITGAYGNGRYWT